MPAISTAPAVGQGMSTGIGDAVNLSWKIAEVVRGRADSSLLETFEAERIPFARSLIATTDRVFQFLVDDGKLAQAVRVHLLPRVVGTLAKFRAPAGRSSLRSPRPGSPIAAAPSIGAGRRSFRMPAPETPKASAVSWQR